MAKLLISSLVVAVGAGPLADRWVGFVTINGTKRSVWDNSKQLAYEQQHPELPANQTHPSAVQTRFAMDAHISNGNASERYVAIEMGLDCAPLSGCPFVLFGLSDKNSDEVLLKSYKSDKIPAAIKILQDNPNHVGAVLDYSDLEFKGYSLTYKWFPSNSSFFGHGGGKYPTGDKLIVYETIAEGLVAPLELFYDPSGRCETPYVTPIRYHPRPAVMAPSAAPLAERWVSFVTINGTKRSVWDNSKQLAYEQQHPELPANQTHPSAVQTRFAMDAHISNGNASERYVAIEMGLDCAPLSGCPIVLFGLSDKNPEEVLLKSYKSNKIPAAIKILQDNPNHVGAVLDYSDLEFKGYSLTYKWFPSNSSFFGHGGGKYPTGDKLIVYETIAEGLVAPLELFYDPSGRCETPYVTPIRYHPRPAVVAPATAPLAERWVNFVTINGTKRTVWDNSKQLAYEQQHPELPANQKHPSAVQTRFPMDAHISNGNSSERYVAIEMGLDCAPLSGCPIVLFGLSDKSSDEVLLKSYKSDKLPAAVKILQDDPNHVGAVLDYSDMEFKGYSLTYRWFPSNSSFFGHGGGKYKTGDELIVYETIAEGLVAPLELFYDSAGTLETPYVTPIRYHPRQALNILVV